MVLGLLSRSRSFSRSFWLFGDRACSSFFSLLKRSRPVRMMCSSILRWRFMSDRTLSNRASLFTEERADDPVKKKKKRRESTLLCFQIIKLNEDQKHDRTLNCLVYVIQYLFLANLIVIVTPGVLRLLMKAFFGVCICSSSKSNSVGVGGLEKTKLFFRNEVT